MSKIEEIVDDVVLEYINAPAADYEVRITRRNKDGAKDVMSYVVDTPKEAAIKLLEYNTECVISMNSTNNGFNKTESKLRRSTYFGAGSERGRWENNWMTKWKFQSEAELEKGDRKLLEGIVEMRNSYVDALEKIEDLEKDHSKV